LLGTEARTLVGPHKHFFGFDGVALPAFGHPLWVGVELFGTRKDRSEVVGDGIDLLRVYQALDQGPTIFSPGGDFGVSRESRSHGWLILSLSALRRT
jgi:hypothetical protein